MWYTNTKTGHAIDLSEVKSFSLHNPAHDLRQDSQHKPNIHFRFLDNETANAEFQNMEEAQEVFDGIAGMLNGDTTK